MKRKVWMVLTVMLMVAGLLFTVSCAKKTVKSDDGITESGGTGSSGQAPAAGVLTEEELARQRALEEGRIETEASAREREMARHQFINEDIYFDYNSSAITMYAQGVLAQKADWLRQNPAAKVTIEGHSDERGTGEYNLALGERRANTVKNYMVNLGISPNRMNTISYGEESPANPAHTEEAWAKNRRSHFALN